MKLFQWVHRKLRQNSIDPFKDFTLGNPCNCLTPQPTYDNEYSHMMPSFSSMNQPGFIKPHHQESMTSYSGLDVQGEAKQETPAAISELFEGFLTIGTFGMEAVNNGPATPTFPMPIEDVTMNDAEVTETDLKLISDELEKFLEAEKEETFYESSGRNSQVSTITLSHKQVVGSEAEDNANKAVCPLQGYLLGSSLEFPETTEVKKERASLAELFRRTKTCQESIETREKAEIQIKQTQKSAMHIMRKILKKVLVSSKSCNTARDDADSASTNKKLHKALRMFHRKVYPENTTTAKDFTKPNKDKIKDASHDCCHEYQNRDPTNPDKGRRANSDTKSTKRSQICEPNWNPPQDGLSCSTSTANNEHWIKTDAEYLVLEL
ncbi:hypothetical protein PIB30_054897 [Stylosanthes scabra]|uniref:LAZY1 n=2 Tax=Stylosanthes scabra TaxID=79078 RepID=A0ABU6RJ11_9FABA|nr:hypothetical protein [Stylosanthes scabra]